MSRFTLVSLTMSAENTPLLLKGYWRYVLGDASGLLPLVSCPWLSLWLPLKLADALARSVGQVCFANNPWSGALILLGLFMTDTAVGIAAIVCSFVAILTAKSLGLADGVVSAGLASYCGVLVGTVTVSLHPAFTVGTPTGLIWTFILAAASYSVMVGVGLNAVLKLVQLPFFTLPFNIATSILFLIFSARTFNEPSSSGDAELNVAESLDHVTVPVDELSVSSITWREVMKGSLLSAGQVYAVEDTACSFLTLLALCLNSPLLVVASYVGGLVGTLTGLLLSNSSQYSAIAAGVWGYGGFLGAGCAIFFLEPSWRSALLAVFNAVSCTLLQAALIPAFAANKLPVFTVPFCLGSTLLLLMCNEAQIQVKRVEHLRFPEQHLASAKQKLRRTDADNESSDHSGEA